MRTYVLTGLSVLLFFVATASTPEPVAAQRPAAVPTFTKDVAPIFYEKCVMCHRPGEVAPMSLLTFEAARPWARAIKNKVVARQMPPWYADPQFGHFLNDPSLTPRQIDTIAAWADGGAPKGSDADLPRAPQFAEGWRHPSGRPPDLVIEMPLDYPVPAEGEIPMINVYAKVPFARDVFVDGVQLVPGNRQVVHHLIANQVTLPPTARVVNGRLMDNALDQQITAQNVVEGQSDNPEARAAQAAAAAAASPALGAPAQPSAAPRWVAGYAVGADSAVAYPAGYGRRMTAGEHEYINFNLHYQATGKPETDRTKLGLWFMKVPMTHEVQNTAIGMGREGGAYIVEGRELLADPPAPPSAGGTPGRGGRGRGGRVTLPNIPPFAANWSIIALTPVLEDITLLAFEPHMHLRGKDMRYAVVYPDGREQTLLNTPSYDFNWQLWYLPQEPIRIPAGSKLVGYGHYDNSTRNRWNPAPDKQVFWSEQSWDEMFAPIYDFVVDRAVVGRPVPPR
jgi:hypothetical protein